jgi:hypothetical protein
MIVKCTKCRKEIDPLNDDCWIDDDGVFCPGCMDPQRICNHDFEEIVMFTSRYYKCKLCGKTETNLAVCK